MLSTNLILSNYTNILSQIIMQNVVSKVNNQLIDMV